MHTYSKTLSTLFIALCLQACAGSGVKPFKLDADPAQVREVLWQGEEEERKQPMLPLLGGMQQPSHDEGVRADAENKSRAVIPASASSGRVQLCEDHFERLQRAVGRDIRHGLSQRLLGLIY